MESILAAAFGRVVNIQEGEADQLTGAAASVFGGVQEDSRMNSASIYPIVDQLPFLVPLLQYYLRNYSKRGKGMQLLTETAIELVRARRKEGSTGRKVPIYMYCLYSA